MTHVQECSENTITVYCTSINLRLNKTSFEIGFACVHFYVQKVKKFKRSIHVLCRAYKEESDGDIYFDEIKTNAYKRPCCIKRFYVKRTGYICFFSYFIVTIILKNTKEYKQFFSITHINSCLSLLLVSYVGFTKDYIMVAFSFTY